jgi:hypothetical protein
MAISSAAIRGRGNFLVNGWLLHALQFHIVGDGTIKAAD